MSSSVMPVPEGDESEHNSPTSLNGSASFNNPLAESKPVVDISRHGTPLQTVEENSPHQTGMVMPQNDQSYASLVNGDMLSYDSSLQHSAITRTMAPGVVRRARSATMTEMLPYPTKSHSCPIPSCGRLFKRLEHLKR